MGAAHTLALASPAIADHVRALTAAALATWQIRWGLAAMDADLAVTAWKEPGRPRVDAAGQWHDAQAGTPANLFWPACAARRIESKLFPGMKHEVLNGEGSLARECAEQAAEDLRRALLACWQVQAASAGGAAAGPSTGPSTGSSPTGDVGPRWSRWLAPVQVRIDLGKGCRLVAVLSGAALNPRTPAPRGGLGAMDARGFHALPAQAELMVGHAEIPLPEIAALQVGDVIVLDTRLHDPLPLRLQGGAATVHAHLGRTGGQRAAQLVSPAKTHPKTEAPT